MVAEISSTLSVRPGEVNDIKELAERQVPRLSERCVCHKIVFKNAGSTFPPLIIAQIFFPEIPSML